MTIGRLEELGRRIERLVVDPESIRAPLVRLVRPILTRIGWQPKSSTRAVLALLEGIRAQADGGWQTKLEELLEAATDELEDNVKSVERATVVNKRPFVGHAAWLRRLYEVVTTAAKAIESVEDPVELRIAGGVDYLKLAPPLALQKTADEEELEDLDMSGPDSSRLLELQLGTIDHLVEAAREETETLGRRRRLLEAARQLLLETSAALPLEEEGVSVRLRSIARRITRIDRLEALGVSPRIGLFHQARTALSRGDVERLHATLLTIDEAAVASGDRETARRTGEALRRLVPSHTERRTEDVERSLDRSATEIFGEPVLEAIRHGYANAREAFHIKPEKHLWINAIREYLAPGAERSMSAAALAVDGCFDVGGVMSPVRITEQVLRPRAVPFPTPELVLLQAKTPGDIPHAIIEDPRMIMLSLAAGRLLTRRFVREEPESKTRTIMRGEVRIYVLDGSTSMIGPRARMRDGILVAELGTLIRRLNQRGRTNRVLVFYRYFDLKLGSTHRVESAKAAIDAITHVTGSARTGGTNIQQALLASFKQVRQARERDPDLAKAQIVLVTDGAAPVDAEMIEEARAGVGDLPLGVSVIALGEENPALRQIVARQRANGERAFYHFIDDERLKEIAEGKIDDGPAIHLPPVLRWARSSSTRELADDLEAEIGDLLEDLSLVERTRDQKMRQRLGADSKKGSDGGLAQYEAAHRDDRALGHRFRRWFPSVDAESASEPPEKGTIEHGDLESVVVLLATVAEVVELVEGSELMRQADAIELLERLLPDARLSPARYEAIVETYPTQVAPGMRTVHAAVRWGVLRRLREKESPVHS